MAAYKSLYAGRQAHHHRNSPPGDYKNLTKPDLTAIGLVLAKPPDPDHPAAEAFQDQTQLMIANLPSHLRSKLPWLTTLCVLHKKLNPLPLISLWETLRHETFHELRCTFMPLCAEGVVTGAQAHYIDWFQRCDWDVDPHTCAACCLTSLAADPELLIALGAVTMSTLAPKNWKKSKRVYFLQCMLAGRARPDSVEGSKLKMLEVGKGFRRLREEHQVVQHIRSQHFRELEASRSPLRPAISPEQDDHSSWTNFVRSENDNLGDLQTSESETLVPQSATPKATIFSIRRKPGAPSKPNVFEQAFKVSQPAPSIRPTDASSSAHSSDTRHTEQGMGSTGIDIFDLYRHSTFTTNMASPAAAISPKPLPKPAPLETDRPPTDDRPRYSLAPATIPRNINNFGDSPPGLRPSTLLNRRANHAPRLRVGKHGQVRGLVDPVSELSLAWDHNSDEGPAWI